MLRNTFRKFTNDPYSKVKPKKLGREFYLDSSKQYMYTPKQSLSFENSKCLIYQNTNRTLKAMYLPKLFSAVVGLSAVVTSNALLDFTIMISLVLGTTGLVAGTHALLGARVLTHMHLLDSGRQVELTYKFAPFLSRSKVYDISEFKVQKTPILMHMWSLHPVPKNMIAYIEEDFSQLLPLYLSMGQFRFFIVHRKPNYVNEEIVANVTNGVYINTSMNIGRVNYFKDRFYEIRK